MSYAVGQHFESFIKQQLQDGRYNNASEIIRDGLRLVEEKEAKLVALKQQINAAIDLGGAYDDDEIAVILANDES